MSDKDLSDGEWRAAVLVELRAIRRMLENSLPEIPHYQIGRDGSVRQMTTQTGGGLMPMPHEGKVR